MEGNHFEFNDNQNQIIRKLFSHMTFVAYAVIGLGGVIGIFGIKPLIADGFGLKVLFFILAAVVIITMGAVTLRSANFFKKIIKTQGDDIGNLMTALDKLTTWFSIITALLCISIAVVILGIIASL